MRLVNFLSQPVQAPGPPLGMPGPPTGMGTLGLMVVIVGGVAGVAGAAGTPGLPGVAGVAGIALGGASAEILFVRNATLLLRVFNGCVVGCDKPPAAGSISSSQAPHLCTEST